MPELNIDNDFSLLPVANEDLPLGGMLVLDFSQFLAGPVAAMRLADLGARVVKIERPTGGDIGRQLAFAGKYLDGDTLSFHIMNRNKESFTADLKDKMSLGGVRELVERADVIIQNFRPGVMERLGFGYEEVKKFNPKIVYGSVSGYGTTGPWRDRPGQDLLAQSMSALPWATGSSEDPPTPFGLAIADNVTSMHLAQGITALLLRRERTGNGGLVETSLLESMLDIQFELISTALLDPSTPLDRGPTNSANAFLAAPYGVYETSDGYISIAMAPVSELGALLGMPELEAYAEPSTWWTKRDEIYAHLRRRLVEAPTEDWLRILDLAGVWCAPVLTLHDLLNHEGFHALDMVQVTTRNTVSIATTRPPMRIDGRKLTGGTGAPRLGEHTEQISNSLHSPRRDEKLIAKQAPS
jgi:crotonobetainyl-CoA:carnitine CoA-transferase CaiB-like acyl-CoA transferase